MDLHSPIDNVNGSQGLPLPLGEGRGEGRPVEMATSKAKGKSPIPHLLSSCPPAHHSSLITHHWALATVAAITAVGLGLRLLAIGHGLPEQYVPDESTMVGGALRMGASKSLQPGTFIYPALLMYVFAAEYLGLLGVGSLTGLFGSVEQFKEFAFVDPTLFYLLPRLAIALTGAACVPVAFLLGRRLYGQVAGVAAAFLVATSVMHVQMSHQARHWVPIALLTLVVLWVALDLAERGRRRDYLLSGILVGLSAATSFNGFLLMAMPVIAHLSRARVIGHQSSVGAGVGSRGSRVGSPTVSGLRTQHPGLRPEYPAPGTYSSLITHHSSLLTTLVIAPVLFFLLNPYVLLQFDRFAAFHTSGEKSIGGQILGHYDSYLQQFLAKQGFTFYAEATLAYEPAITVLGLLGAFLVVRRFRNHAWLVLGYPAFHYLMFATTAPSMEQRYMLPAVVVLALPAGLAVSHLVDWARGRLGSASTLAAVVAAVAVTIALPALRYDWLLTQPDTRTLAKNWIEATLPAGSDVAVEGYGPPLAADIETLRAQQQAQPASLGNRDQWVLEKGLPAGEVAYRLTRLNLVDNSPREDNLTPYLASHLHRYYVVSDFRWKSDHMGHQGLKSYLARNGKLVASFYPSSDASYVPSDLLNNLEDPLHELWKVDRPGPRIEIYEVSP